MTLGHIAVASEVTKNKEEAGYWVKNENSVNRPPQGNISVFCIHFDFDYQVLVLFYHFFKVNFLSSMQLTVTETLVMLGVW